MEQETMRMVERRRTKKTKSFSVWRLSESCSLDPNYSSFCFLSITSTDLNKQKKKTEKTAWTSSVLCSVVLFPPRCWSSRDRKQKFHHILFLCGRGGKEKISLGGHRWKDRKKKRKLFSLLVFSIRKRLKETTEAYWLSFFFLLCGKCCSSLLTLPGAHPVCETFNMRIVPLKWWWWWFTPFEMYCIFYLFDLFSLCLSSFKKKMACTMFLADLGFRTIEWIIVDLEPETIQSLRIRPVAYNLYPPLLFVATLAWLAGRPSQWGKL